MTHIRGKLLASVAGLVVGFAAGGASADQLLTGAIMSASGQKLEYRTRRRRTNRVVRLTVTDARRRALAG
jgi:hypothetical protein